ncbi:TPA: hypothetical protein ACHS6Z_002369, partial [Klebsiella pneumoniae]
TQLNHKKPRSCVVLSFPEPEMPQQKTEAVSNSTTKDLGDQRLSPEVREARWHAWGKSNFYATFSFFKILPLVGEFPDSF